MRSAKSTPDLRTSQPAHLAAAQVEREPQTRSSAADDTDREVQLHLVGREDDAQPRTAKPNPAGAKYNPEQIAEALALVAAGVSQREAGRRIGASGNAVRAWVAKAATG
uniref:transposase n=1 Tax=Rhodococcus marinonascens TaxID=38311 RepID=UPI0035A26058